MKPIYLDHNSTTAIDPSVAQAIYECYSEGLVNPASQHQAGQKARRKLENCRLKMTEMLGGITSGMQTDYLILTSGGTESNNLALHGLAYQAFNNANLNQPHDAEILVSAVEHPSVIGASEQLSRLGFVVKKIPVDSDGFVCIDVVEKMVSSKTILISVMMANNETGVIMPIQQIAKLCRSRKIFFHTDAVQAVTKIDVNLRDLGVDALTFSSHKFHGPTGIGGLLLRHGVTVNPILHGGFQQSGMRPGTENVALAVGMSHAMELYGPNDEIRSRMKTLRDRLQNRLVCQFPNIVINGDIDRTPHTLNFSVPGIDRQSFLLAADMSGLAISTGSACASGSSDPSPVLLAMNLDPEIINGSVRISLGAQTTEQEIEDTIDRISRIIANLGSKSQT
ncbi:MAG: cysteine desulfurase family protein [Planctomycetota bacterium]